MTPRIHQSQSDIDTYCQTSPEREITNPHVANANKKDQIKPQLPLEYDKINILFTLLADDKVLKGLRLLGGFADYLETSGKDILDFKR